MKNDEDNSAATQRLRVLAEFRHELRSFLHFSEQAASKANLQGQQHQLLLQVAGAPSGVSATVAYAAERLGLRHNSVVELTNRCVEAGLLARSHDTDDRRRVVLRVTPKGQRILNDLSEDHARELNELAPRLIRSLKRIQATGTPQTSAGAMNAVSVNQAAAVKQAPSSKQDREPEKQKRPRA